MARGGGRSGLIRTHAYGMIQREAASLLSHVCIVAACMIITHPALIALAPVLFLSLMALAAASSLLLEAVVARFAVCCSALVLCTCQPGSAPLTGLQSSEAGSSIGRVAVLPVRLAATWLPAALRLEIVRHDTWRVQSRRSLTVVLLRSRVYVWGA